MAALFGGGSGPKPTSAPPPPSRSAQEISDAAERDRRRFYGAQGGRSMTSFTGGRGAAAPFSAVVNLLGNAGRM